MKCYNLTQGRKSTFYERERRHSLLVSTISKSCFFYYQNIVWRLVVKKCCEMDESFYVDFLGFNRFALSSLM